MNYWLMKSEPGTFGIDDHARAPRRTAGWDGVRNYQARNNMRAMKVGDLGFFYHSQSGLDVVGIVRVIAPAHPERGSDDPRWECVDVRAETDLPRPVTLVAIKVNRKLAEMALVKNSRLSVQPVSHAEWVEVCRMGGLSPAPASKE
jgi:predicted RNA-binding protein with PUA-like domain